MDVQLGGKTSAVVCYYGHTGVNEKKNLLLLFLHSSFEMQKPSLNKSHHPGFLTVAIITQKALYVFKTPWIFVLP
jgi:hypothetical protein